MAYQFLIYDYSITTSIDISARTLSAEIVKTLDSGITTFKLECRAITDTHLFDKMTIKDGGVTIMEGIIVSQSDKTGGNFMEKRTTFSCQDWGYFFLKRVAAEIYEGQTASYILTDIIAKYATEFTGTNIDTSEAVITEVNLQYVTLKDAVEYILGMSSDWHYYIDNDKDFHFFYVYDSDGNTITHADLLSGALAVDYSGIDHYNRVWLVGIKQADANAIDVYYTSDGTQRYFGPLPYDPSDMSIFLTPSGLPEYEFTIAEESQDDGSSYEMLYNADKKIFYFPAYKNPASFAGAVRVNFKPIRQYIDYYENTDDIDTYSLMEKAIKNTTVTDKIEARKYGQNEVKKSSVVKRKVKFDSDTANAKALEIGQKCAVNINTGSWNITGDFLVKAFALIIIKQYSYVSIEMEEL